MTRVVELRVVGSSIRAVLAFEQQRVLLGVVERVPAVKRHEHVPDRQLTRLDEAPPLVIETDANRTPQNEPGSCVSWGDPSDGAGRSWMCGPTEAPSCQRHQRHLELRLGRAHIEPR